MSVCVRPTWISARVGSEAEASNVCCICTIASTGLMSTTLCRPADSKALRDAADKFEF